MILAKTKPLFFLEAVSLSVEKVQHANHMKSLELPSSNLGGFERP